MYRSIDRCEQLEGFLRMKQAMAHSDSGKEDQKAVAVVPRQAAWKIASFRETGDIQEFHGVMLEVAKGPVNPLLARKDRGTGVYRTVAPSRTGAPP